MILRKKNTHCDNNLKTIFFEFTCQTLMRKAHKIAWINFDFARYMIQLDRRYMVNGTEETTYMHIMSSDVTKQLDDLVETK